MILDEIDDGRALEALRAEWSELWQRCPSATPFQAPEWLLPWWRHLSGGRLRVLAVRDRDGRLVGLAPFCVSNYFGLPLRRLVLLGTGVTDYLDVLVDPACAPAVSRELGAWLAAQVRGGAFGDFQQQRPEAMLAVLPLPQRLREVTVLQEVCPALHLTQAAPVPKGIARNVRYGLRQLRRRFGEVEISRVTGRADLGEHLGEGTQGTQVAVSEDLEEHLEALFDLHGARWRRRLQPGVFGRARVRRFHREVAAGFLDRGWLRLYGLRVAGRLRAALYCFSARGRTYYYGGGFDPELAWAGPGTILTAHAVETAHAEGDTEFDFLRGDEAYKYRWGARDRVNQRRLLVPSGPVGAWVRGLVRGEMVMERWGKERLRRVLR